MRKKIYVCISLDVEEEGLFSGTYRQENVGLKNIAELPKLKRLSEKFPLTLYCAYPVFEDRKCRQTLAYMRDECGAEIGCHLHHWSTPPFSRQTAGKLLSSDLLAPELLESKLNHLFTAAHDFLGKPATSFRMGRWDLKKQLLPLLAQHGILVDSSICPLRNFINGPDHFLALPDPWWQELPDGRMLEAPITQVPLSKFIAKIWHKLLPKTSPLMDKFYYFGALSANPLWHGDKIMRLAVKTHTARGGKVLNFFWHSSEMMPGGSPHIPDRKAANRLLTRIHSFCDWLLNEYDVIAVTATQLAQLPIAINYPIRAFEKASDW